MAFGKHRRKHGDAGGDVHGELTITPLLDLFVALIPFLIMSVVLSKVNILDVGIASPGPATTQKEAVRERDIAVQIHKGFVEISVENKTVAKISRNGANDQAWLQSFHAKLVEVKKQKLDDLKIYIEPQAGVKLETVMAFMDQARELRTSDGDLFRKEADGKETKLRYLFPKIILKGVY